MSATFLQKNKKTGILAAVFLDYSTFLVFKELSNHTIFYAHQNNDHFISAMIKHKLLLSSIFNQ